MAVAGSVALLAPMALAVLVCSIGSVEAQRGLSVDYYSSTCPRVEAIVREEMTRALRLAPSLAAPLLRLHFHDCFVGVRF